MPSDVLLEDEVPWDFRASFYLHEAAAKAFWDVIGGRRFPHDSTLGEARNAAIDKFLAALPDDVLVGNKGAVRAWERDYEDFGGYDLIPIGEGDE